LGVKLKPNPMMIEEGFVFVESDWL